MGLQLMEEPLRIQHGFRFPIGRLLAQPIFGPAA